MKKFLLFFFIVFSKMSYGQNVFCDVLPPDFWCANYAYLDTIDFTQDTTLIAIDTSEGCTTWELGHSYKTSFDSASSPLGLVTDSIHPYGIDVDCGFILKIPSDFFFGITIVLFEHKFETDSLLDGGYIEYSCDQGQNWRLVNAENFENPPIELNFYNYAGLPNSLWNQTMPALRDTVPAFTGTTTNWQWSGFQIVWYLGVMRPDETRWQECINFGSGSTDSLYVRFNFESDGNNTDKAGWMIRKIIYGTADVGGDIIEFASQPLKIYPNPANDKMSFELPPDAGKLNNITISDIAGNRVSTFANYSSSSAPLIDISSLSNGIYFVLVETDKFVFRQKMVKQ